MKIKYLGPNDHVVVEPYGPHYRDQVKSYPKDFGEELLATSTRQRFEETDEPVSVEADTSTDHEHDLGEKTVPELTAMLQEKGVEVPPKTRKADLIKMLESG